MYHSRKLPVLIQRPLRLPNGRKDKSADEIAAKQGRLYIAIPDKPGRHTRLDKQVFTIGRSRRNDIVLSNENIAPHHARLKQTADGWEVEDLGSTQGTILNGLALEPNSPKNWSPNQPLQIAGYTLRWMQPANGPAFPVFGPSQAAASPPVISDDGLSGILSRPWPYFAIALILIWLMVILGVPVLLPFLMASILTFVGIFITPGFLLGDMITRRLGLDRFEQLALALPLGIVVLAVPGMISLLLHLTLTELAIGWFATSTVVVAVWLLGQSRVSFFSRLFHEAESNQERPKTPWAIDELLLLFFLVGLYVLIFPTLSLYKIDGDAYAVNTFAVDALAGLPLNAKEPIFGTDLGTGVRMVFNQYLPLSYLWSYFAGLDPIDLMSLFSRQVLALWSVLAMYMLGKEAGAGSRRFGLFTAAIQLLVYTAAPFWHDDNVSLYFFERINADKFMVMVLLVPPCIALAIRYMRNGRFAAWLAAALVALAASTIHPLSAAMLALALCAFGGCHLLFNLRQWTAWKRVVGLAGLAAMVMLLPIIQLFLSRSDAPLASSYPNSFEDWPMGKEMVPILPFVNIPAIDLYGPLPQLQQLSGDDANSTTNPFLVWRFAVNMGRQRLIVFDEDQFIAHPRLFLEPPYLLALLLLPLLLLRIRRDPAAQFAVGTTLAILMLMFNPLVTPLIGSLVMPWILWRLIWLLPYTLIIALAIQQVLLLKVKVSTPEVEVVKTTRRWMDFIVPDWSKRIQGAYLLTGVILILGLLASPIIKDFLRQLHYDSSTSYFYPTPQRIFDRLNTQLSADKPAMVLADQDLSVTVAAYVAHANILAHRVPTTSEIFPADQQDIALQRLIDQEAFFRTPYLTAESINILSRYGVKYIITSSGGKLDMQLQLAPQWFTWQLDDQSYSLYAVTSLPEGNALILLGNEALRQRDWATARAYYETTLNQNPGDLLALAGLAEIAQEQGQFEGALSWWQRAVAQADLPILHARLGQLYALRSEFEQSVAEWEVASSQAPNVARYYVGLGDACLLSGLEACAEEAYATAATKRSLPDEIARLLLEANLWQQQGRFDRAIPLYEKAVTLQPTRFNEYILESAYREAGQEGKSEGLLEDLRANDPFSPELITVEANTLATVNQVEEAIALYKRAIWLQMLQAEESVETRQALAQLLLDAGLLEEAEEEIEALLALAPYNGNSYRIQGDLYQLQGKFEEATEAYEQAFLFEPTRVTIYATLNNHLRRHNGRPEDWLEILESAVRFNPNEPSLYLALGDHWEQQGNREEAINAYLTALEKLDTDGQSEQFLPPSTRQGRAFIYSHLARIYEDRGQTTAALNYYQAMAAVAPDAPWTQIILGDAWLRQGNLETAETFYSQALENDPNYLIAYVRLAELNEERGNLDEAVALQLEALQIAELTLTQPLQTEETIASSQASASLALPVFSDSESTTDAAVPEDSDTIIQQLQLAEEELSTLGLLTHLYVLSGRTEQAIELYENRLAYIEQIGGSPTLEAQYQKGLGDLFFSKGQFDLAIEAYQQALTVDRWWPEARLGLANAFLAEYNVAAAVEELETAVEFTPGDMEIQLALADARLRQGQPDKARLIYETMAANYPNSARAKEALAEYYTAYNQPAEAISLYQEALNRDPDNARLYLALSQLWQAQGDAEQAQSVLESGLNVVVDATDLTTALSILYLEQNKPVEALGILGQGISRVGENTPLLLATGSYYASRANYDQAAEWYEAALSANPNSAAVQVALGDLALHLGNVDEALEHYEEAVNLAPGSTGYWLTLAAAYQSLDRYDEAMVAYSLALDIEPDLTGAYIGMAEVLQAQARWSEAESTYVAALVMMPNSARLLSAYAGFLLDRGDETKALELLEQARGLVHDVPTMVAIAALYDELGRAELSEAILQTALELEPGSLVALIGLGDFYEGQGRIDEAQLLYEQVIALNPGLPLGYLRLGNLANEAGDQETADAYAALAQQVAPGYFGP